jgi:AraC-like DNA-binding protein
MPARIDTENLQSLIRHFYIATQLRVAIFDFDFNEVIAWPKEENVLCRLIKSTKKGWKRCRTCDLSSQFRVKQNIYKNYIYTCHAGLFDAIAPIMDNRRIIGYMMVGQCVPGDMPIQKAWNFSLNSCEDILDISDIKTEYYNLPRLTKQQMESCVQIMNACALYIGNKKYVNPDHDEIFTKIKSYTDIHLSEDLSVETLCSQLFLSRNLLFKTVKKETGLTLGQYIQAKRLEQAQSLLKNNERSIAEIAELCGISDYNYFSRIFKKQFGITPRDYRLKWNAKKEP